MVIALRRSFIASLNAPSFESASTPVTAMVSDPTIAPSMILYTFSASVTSALLYILPSMSDLKVENETLLA